MAQRAPAHTAVPEMREEIFGGPQHGADLSSGPGGSGFMQMYAEIGPGHGRPQHAASAIPANDVPAPAGGSLRAPAAI